MQRANDAVGYRKESFIRNAAVRVSKYYNTIDRPVFAFVVSFTTARFRFTEYLQQFRPTGKVGLGKETSINCLNQSELGCNGCLHAVWESRRFVTDR